MRGNSNNLEKLIKELPYDIIMAEVGCYAGESSLIFMSSNKIKKFYAIDPWSKIFNGDIKNKTVKEINTINSVYNLMDFAEECFDIRMKPYNNVIKMKMTFDEAFDKLPNLDFIYIDANHDYEFVLNDINIAKKIVKSGGIIAGHDYHHTYPGVIKAVGESFDINNVKIYPDFSWFTTYTKL